METRSLPCGGRGAVTCAPWRGEVAQMDMLLSIFLLCLGAGGRGDSSHSWWEKRGNAGLYSHFGDDFETIAYAAMPLHQPLPVIHVMSPTVKYKWGAPHDTKLEPTRHYYARQPIRSSSIIDTRVTEPAPSPPEHQAAEVIYARPNKRGGYTYRRPGSARRPPLATEPFLIRVHKYKVVRDR